MSSHSLPQPTQFARFSPISSPQGYLAGIDQSLEEAALDLGARPFSSRRKLGEPRLRLALG
jgi:ABC-type Fe3+ transport system permease subunit